MRLVWLNPPYKEPLPSRPPECHSTLRGSREALSETLSRVSIISFPTPHFHQSFSIHWAQPGHHHGDKKIQRGCIGCCGCSNFPPTCQVMGLLTQALDLGSPLPACPPRRQELALASAAVALFGNCLLVTLCFPSVFCPYPTIRRLPDWH